MIVTWNRFAIAILCGWMAACASQQPVERPAPPAPPERDPHARAEFELGPDALEARVKELTDGYQAMEVGQGGLEAFKALELQLTRGQCYVAVLRLGSGAAFGPHARRGVKVVTAFELEDMVQNDSAIAGPGAVLDAGCPLVDGHLVIDLQATFDADRDATRFHELGAGPYTWTLYSAPISEDELAVLKAQVTGDGSSVGGGKSTSVAGSRASKAGVASGKKEPTAAVRSIWIRNRCPKSSKLYFGPDPSSSPGPVMAVKARGSLVRKLRIGDSVWLLDASGKGVGIVTVTDAIEEVTISQNCLGIAGK